MRQGPIRACYARLAPLLPALAVALAAAVSLAIIVNIAHSTPFSDEEAYWKAALRLREGAPLYGQAAFLADSYHYAPWFAAAWIPLTFLPHPLVQVMWALALLAASLWLVWRANPLVGAIVAPFLIWSCFLGNVQALMVAGLAYGVERRSGPLWIGLAASLKITPILFAIVYVGRRQWGAAGLTAGLAGLLWLPGIALGFLSYPDTIGGTFSILSRFGIGPYVIAVVAVGGYTLWRPSWRAATVAVLVALPRLLAYDLSYLLVGWRRSRGETRATPGQQP